MTTPPSSLLVACPHCGKASPWNSRNAYRPFCCERCKMIDLGQWADEAFRVAVPDTEQEFTPPNYPN
ncbi:MAG: DNA gyrase inhibitor YacG [Gallionellales bacterium CG03_land_8_20_14_0_80_55_15]|nr:MAG: DNA gyrase inhibitor YacG [Gallionellales bacterium CG03_land_8_20_14_0_80_55_15]PJC03613.1 MAG: DNA gyrase inhibitor YacG [Gallionellales bacterium CG_4_9_14_0_8_um_filter_55_61]HCJ50725.1 DNA gyrase inhibitor YacG [Gallionella sp.]